MQRLYVALSFLLVLVVPAAQAVDDELPVRKIAARVQGTDEGVTVMVYGTYASTTKGKNSRYEGCFRSSKVVGDLTLNKELPNLLAALNGNRPFVDYVFSVAGKDYQFPHNGFRSASFVKDGENTKLVLKPVRAWSSEQQFPYCTAEMLDVKNANKLALWHLGRGWACYRKVGDDKSRELSITQEGFDQYRGALYGLNLDIGGQLGEFPKLKVEASEKEQKITGSNANGSLELFVDLTKPTKDQRGDIKYPGTATIVVKGKTVEDKAEYSCGNH